MKISENRKNRNIKNWKKEKAASNPGSKFHSFGQQICYFGQQLRFFFGQQNYFFEQQDYLFGQQILMEKAANFISEGSRFYRDWQQFLLK
jgi:hypothetical protein